MTKGSWKWFIGHFGVHWPLWGSQCLQAYHPTYRWVRLLPGPSHMVLVAEPKSDGLGAETSGI